MIGRDMAGCLPLLVLTAATAVSAFASTSLHGRGPQYWFVASIVTGILGVCLLIYARLPLYRQGKFLTFGPKDLPPRRLPAYRWAWRLVVLTIFMQVLLLVITI